MFRLDEEGRYQMTSAAQRDILTVEQTADLLQSSRHMVYTLIRRGDLKAGRIGRKYWRIARSQVLRLCGDTPGRPVRRKRGGRH